MTIDEAISHAREVAECQKMSARLIEDNAYIPESVDKEAITYGNTICANEHEQLAEWLEELKQYRAIGTPEECRAAKCTPIAYDPDKVVEQLEKLKSLVPVNRVLDDIINDKPKELGMLIAYEKAIKIVKGGGVDG